MSLPGRLFADIEFLSIADQAVVMYNAPSIKAEKLYVASRHLPVEAVVNVAGWVKVMDSTGKLAWVEQNALSSKRYVIVTVPLADVFQSTSVDSEPIFQAQENVVLEWIETNDEGWVKIRHRDGQTGYVRVGQVWGI